MAQDRLTKLADRRAHLDLQINLIAEQELTAIFRVACRLAENGGIDVRTCDDDRGLAGRDRCPSAGKSARSRARHTG